MPQIRHEINILNALLSAATGVSATSNESVSLDTTQYNGTLTVYFEIVADTSLSITSNVTLRRKGTSTDDATCAIPLLTTAFTLIRSSSFTPPAAATEYVVFIDTAAGATKNVKSARIIVIQNASSITSYQEKIEIGATQSYTASTLTALTSPKYWKYTSANWDGPITAYWETCFTANSTKITATAELQVADGTGDGFANWVAVGSDITTTSATATRVRSAAVTLTAGRNYRVVYKTSNSKSTINVYSASIVITGPPSFALVGSGSTITGGTTAMAGLSTTQIAFIEDTSDNLQTYSFNGSTWSTVGVSLTITGTLSPALAALSSTRVAFIDASNDSLRAYDFDGSNWALVGSGLTITTVGGPALAALSSSRVAFIDGTNQSLRAYDFDGSNWALVGSGLTISGTGTSPRLAALSSTRVAFIDNSNDSLRAYDFDGSNWALVGSGLTITTTSSSMAALSSSRITLFDASSDSLAAYDFDGSNWSPVGVALAITTTGGQGSSMAALSSTRISFIDALNDSLRAYDFSMPPITLLEPQYLLANAALAAGTALQTFLTKWDSTEWTGVTNTYTYAVDSANGSTSVIEADTAAGTQITGSVVTSPDNQGISSSMTMPSSGNLDTKATTNGGNIYGARILVAVAPVADTTIGGFGGYYRQFIGGLRG